MSKKDAYYFSHDANAQDDPKCMVLIDQLGMEGYGIFWALIEKLRSESEYKLPLIVLESFAKRWGTSKEKVNAVVKNYSLFIIENDNFFYSQRLKDSMELKSLKASESANKRWNKQLQESSNANDMRTDANALRNDAGDMRSNAIKGKERKVKEKKVNKTEFIPPTLEEVYEYFKEKGHSQHTAQTAFYYYQNLNWFDSNDKKIVNWKNKMLSVWMKEETKIKPQSNQIVFPR